MMAEPEPFRIGIVVYEGVELLDVAAPYEIFQWMAKQWHARTVCVLMVAQTCSSITTRDGLQMLPQATYDQVPTLDLIWVPGGATASLEHLMEDQVFLDFLRTRSAGAAYVTSVCEGALLLAKAGLLDGYKATTYWKSIPCLRTFPNVTVIGGESLDGVNVYYPRFVVDASGSHRQGIRVTGGGISSGLDEALELVKLICGEEIAENVQREIQYFPAPPVQAVLPYPSGCEVKSLVVSDHSEGNT